MSLTLKIEEKDYVLLSHQDGAYEELSRLSDGPRRLLPSSLNLSGSLLEAAIESAENWLMPYVSEQRGQALEVIDLAGRLVIGLVNLIGTTSRSWSLEESERIFLKLVHMTTGRYVSAAVDQHHLFVADWLLIRELAHHGQFKAISLRSHCYKNT